MAERILRSGTPLYLGDLRVVLAGDAAVRADGLESDQAFAEHLAAAGVIDLHRPDLEKSIERGGKKYFRTFGRNAEEILSPQDKPKAAAVVVSEPEEDAAPVKRSAARGLSKRRH